MLLMESEQNMESPYINPSTFSINFQAKGKKSNQGQQSKRLITKETEIVMDFDN